MKRYRYRLYPDKEQAGQSARVFGCARVTYNDVIAARRTAHAAGEKSPSVNDLMKLMARSKKTEERAWLGEVTDVALQQSMRDADTAYQNFFAALKTTKAGTKRGAGKRVGVPRFKSRKDHRDSFRITGRQNFAVRKVAQHRAQVRLPKIGWVHFTLSRELPTAPSSVTVIREADGRYYVSFVVDPPARIAPEPVYQVVGIDLGLTHLAILAHDDGSTEKIENPRHLKKSCESWPQHKRSWPAGRKARPTGPSPASRLRPCTGRSGRLGWITTTSWPGGSLTRTKSSAWKPYQLPGWDALVWPSPYTMPGGESSSDSSRKKL